MPSEGLQKMWEWSSRIGCRLSHSQHLRSMVAIAAVAATETFFYYTYIYPSSLIILPSRTLSYPPLSYFTLNLFFVFPSVLFGKIIYYNHISLTLGSASDALVLQHKDKFDVWLWILIQQEQTQLQQIIRINLLIWKFLIRDRGYLWIRIRQSGRKMRGCRMPCMLSSSTEWKHQSLSQKERK